ncbi:MAG TPA: hypothetical protein VFW23_10720 [Tepidisphaeraceae bacterium]|nr:hypothetical protein [Tepidisphaeraceae bacterium]
MSDAIVFPSKQKWASLQQRPHYPAVIILQPRNPSLAMERKYYEVKDLTSPENSGL